MPISLLGEALLAAARMLSQANPNVSELTAYIN